MRKNGRKSKNPLPAVAVLGVVPAGIVDPEIHRQISRRHPWPGTGHLGRSANDHCTWRHHRHTPDLARGNVDG